MSLSPLRVGLVGPVPPPHGGMANQLRQLHRLLEAEGLEVSLLAVNAPYRPAWIRHLRGVRAFARLLPYFMQLHRTAKQVDVLHVFANSGWSWHLFAAPAIWVARMTGTPIIINYRGGNAGEFLARQARWVLPSLRRADRLVVPSGFLESVFGEWGIEAQIVPNIIDLERFRAGAGDEPDLKAPHLIVTRNLEPIYDVGTALRAFSLIRARLPGARLTVAGEGPQRAELESLAQRLEIAPAVTFAGRMTNDDIAGLYHEADLMLNASLVDNMPISLLESLASGVPVVSTNAGGIPYLVEDGVTARLVEPGDDIEMAAATLAILTDAETYRRMAAAGSEAIQSYAWPRVRDQWLACYDAIR